MVNYGPSYLVAAVASMGGLLFGYDIGVMANVLEMDYFKKFFNNPSDGAEGVIVSFLTLGCFIGSLIAGQVTDIFSRKRSILAASIVFVGGSIIQGASNGYAMLVIGRFINGLAVGILSQAVPTYQSEVSAPEVRGRLISLQQWAITWGIAIAFWIGVGLDSIDSNKSWRITLYLQSVPSGILFAGMFFMPFSPRWLASKDRYDEALVVLARLRSGGDTTNPEVLDELETIKEGIRIDRESAKRSYLDLLKYPIKRRLSLGVITQVLQQLTGINVIMYYAPRIFKQAGIGNGDDSNINLIATGVNGLVNVLFTIPAILYVDRWGRRKTLIIGAIGCGTAYLILALCIAIGGDSVDENGSKVVVMHSNGASITAIVMVYVFVASFAMSWGPVGWIYPAEIFPMDIRAKATSVTTAANWLLNFVVGLAAPALIKKITYGIYLIFTGFMALAIVAVYFFYPETKGRTLEQMEIVFTGSIWANKDYLRVEQAINKENS
ncbi:High-affinity glucose transporter [Smittium mucronatum]|uniref:High-affinity glucose transporter n=1 Tax=Smittium mucronatum TaxID=133383 RepID=A0A1R0GW17_9FUNG|nr:High-affinity glucose transporter [Smittium mucronatum]